MGDGRQLTPSGLSVAGRAAWGADESLGGHEPYEQMTPTAIVVHHSHTPGELDDGTALRDLQRLHVGERGWNDIGYHLAVGRAGDIYECRRSDDPLGTSGQVVLGAHAFSANVGSIGIAVLGDFHDDRPTDAAWASLVALCAALCRLHGIDPLGGPVPLGRRVVTSPISGHRDARPEDVHPIRCPGAALHALLPELAAQVAASLGAQDASMEEWRERTRRRRTRISTGEVLDALDEVRGPWPGDDR